MKVIFFTLLLIVSIPATAKRADWEKLSYKDFEKVVEAPPQEGSQAYIKDFEILIQLQEQRTNEECRFARYLKWPNFATFFSKDKKDWIDESQLPVSFQSLLNTKEVEHYKGLMNKVLNLSTRVTKYYKEHYARPRPSDADDRVHPCVEVPEGNTSYPSSHTSKGIVVACLLSEKLKEQKEYKRAEDIMNYGIYMGDLRAIVGVHHPSDVESGKVIGLEICHRLLEEKSFREEWDRL
ncbi:MAG: phosphatase PAP2 family protein [Bdellovibrionales bacterium]|nr:phosphatase PAP2 family protein [Bdellovibrionales bacterium]